MASGVVDANQDGAAHDAKPEGKPEPTVAPVVEENDEVVAGLGNDIMPADTPLSPSASVKTTMHIPEPMSKSDNGLPGQPESPTYSRHSLLTTPNGSELAQDHSYFSNRPQTPTSFRSYPRSPSSAPPSRHASSTSLHALYEEGDLDPEHHELLYRPPSTQSAHGIPRNRRISHSKSSSTSHPHATPPSRVQFGSPTDLQHAAAQPQPRSARPLRSRSSNPSQNALFIEMSGHKQGKDRLTSPQGAFTVGNTPMSSPGLFVPPTNTKPTTNSEGSTIGSPRLHPTQLPTPKETTTAEVEYDMYTGNKLINNYEVTDLLGRGQFGKVKKGRDIENDILVAIKIVPRYSNKRRLGRLGAPEDRVKKEVAILKKARHQNVVSLLEVIDDPNRHKVYIVLEYVEHGEIRWHTRGWPEITTIYNRQLDFQRRGEPYTIHEHEQDAYFMQKAFKKYSARQRLQEKYDARSNPDFFASDAVHWDVGDDEEDEENGEPSQEHLQGTMYGPYTGESYLDRKFSLANSETSHLSSEYDRDDDEQTKQVPTLTMEEARGAFRDTLLGLEFLHFQGIIHRDIKPANLLVAGNGHIKISDFGVSYLGRPVSNEEESTVGETEATTLDDPRELARTVGTPAFYAPELCSEDPTEFGSSEEGAGPRVTGAIDMWALGVTLYSMVYGRLPFYGNQHTGMTLFQQICKTEVFIPAERLMPVQQTEGLRTPSRLHADKALSSNKRLDHEYKTEDIPSSLKDLIGVLLTKDPNKRITIENAKKHPWVVEDIDDPGQWIAGTDPKAEGKQKIVVDDKDVSYGVVKRSLVERAISGVTRTLGGLIGRRESRKRATSTATSASASTESVTTPSVSSGSTVGKDSKVKDGRRASLRGDEVLVALKASRETAGEHPLAQSQTASPAEKETPNYFSSSLTDIKAISAGATLLGHDERQGRPRGPDRTISAVSTAESTKTIRAPQSGRGPSLLDPHGQEIASPSLVESASTSLGGIFSGAVSTARGLTGMRSRERRPIESERSPSTTRTSSIVSSEGDAHASPSLALSTTSASADLEAPEALRTESLNLEQIPSRRSPTSPTYGKPRVHHQPQVSSEENFQHAEAINQRKAIQEAKQRARQEKSESGGQLSDDGCPPSPDDELQFQKSLTDEKVPPPSTVPSASTLASSGGLSQSTSNPSIPSVVSEASSLAAESYFPEEKVKVGAREDDAEPGYMRTAETIKADTTPTGSVDRPLVDKEREYIVQSLEQQQEAYADQVEEEEGESEDEGLMFGSSAKKASPRPV